jgi:transposase
MDKGTAFWVGIDLHQSALMLAAFRGWEETPAIYDTLDPQGPALGRLLRKLRVEAPVQAAYEASGCGYWLARRMKRWGVDCQVVAPSLIPRRPGSRVKTDKRDALALATMHRGGLLSYVRVPGPKEERVRRIVRTREMVRRDVHRSKQRVLKVLQGLGHRYGNRKKWTLAFWQWLRGLALHEEEREVIDLLLAELEVQEALLADADARIGKRSQDKPHAEPVGRLRCLRGIDTLSAMVLQTEVWDMSRFARADQFMSWVGLGVSEFTSIREWRGRITRTGNSRCRRILVEAAWNNTRRPHVSKQLRDRSQGQPPAVIAHAWRAQQRLHKMWRTLEPKVGSKKAAVAMARELAGFIWAIWLAKPELLTARNG